MLKTDDDVYKIISVTDHDGNTKKDWMNYIKCMYGGMGKILNKELYPRINSNMTCCFRFSWLRNPQKMLRTSPIEQYIEDGDNITVITRNSIYKLQKQ